MFESRLWSHLRALDRRRAVFVESESRKIGEVRVPDRLLEAMRGSDCIRLEVPLPARIRLLRAEYQHLERDRAALHAQLDCLTALHGRHKVAQWKQLANDDDWDAVVERLLLEHYDPAYRKSIDRNFARAASATVIRIATDAVEEFKAAARVLAA